MSLSNRRTFLSLLTAPLGLSACGFRPIYGNGSAAAQMHGRISLGDFDGLQGFQMREQLETRLGIASEAVYNLEVVTSIDRKGLAITQDGSITRYNLSGKAGFVVRRFGADVVFADTVEAFTAFNATASAYATRVAEQDAYRRLVVALADRIVARMAITAEDWLE